VGTRFGGPSFSRCVTDHCCCHTDREVGSYYDLVPKRHALIALNVKLVCPFIQYMRPPSEVKRF
jgi:hypothetical protein